MRHSAPDILPGFWAWDYTPVIPQFYWNVESAEQRIKYICMLYDKLIAYVNHMHDDIYDEGGLYDIVLNLQKELPELVQKDVEEIVSDMVTTGEFAEAVKAAIEKLTEELNQQIADEITNRYNADNALQAQIDFNKAALNRVNEPICSPIYQFDGITQSMCAANINGVETLFISQFNSENDVVIKVVQNNEVIQASESLEIGHCNSLEYYNGYLYAATSPDDNPRIAKINASTLTVTQTLNVQAYSISFYNGEFYVLLNDEVGKVFVYDTEFNQLRSISVPWAALSIMQTCFVCEKGIFVVQNEYENCYGNSIQQFDFNGNELGYFVCSVNAEFEQMAYINGKFYVCGNTGNFNFIALLSLDRLYGTIAERFAALDNSAPASDAGINVYYNPSTESTWGDGSEEHPFKSLALLAAMTSLTNQVNIYVMADSQEDRSLYQYRTIFLYPYNKNNDILMPRVSTNGYVRYSGGSYNIETPFVMQSCNALFSNVTFKSRTNTLFSNDYPTTVVFLNCTFDFSNGAWRLDEATGYRQYVFFNLKLIGDGTTQLNTSADIGTFNEVLCLDARSIPIFKKVRVGFNNSYDAVVSERTSRPDMYFAIGANLCGFKNGSAGDSVFNIAGASANRLIQLKADADDNNLYWRKVLGFETIIINPDGSIKYPNLNPGNWNALPTS